ncbi:alpha/beta fold hydrolase [Arthrobacter agilis]|uniref:alpha/beta fold hydrolase n=1 Tax=Arthrobacter agilis TaxID=37921 RepID=UPI0027801281|nr:alpha/beta fold hydrolase [Arthrobacter agilis]MDQ0733642.1 pimeloyl-ACP methyl ester carboxylesterase [Arthrobacter agilis]
MDVLRERHRTIRSEGADLAVFEYGLDPGPDTPTLVFVHGYPDDHRVFLPVLRELAPTHHLVAFDTRNAGRSHPLDGAGFALAELVDDIFAVLAAATADAAPEPASDTGGSRRVRLVGHDWGSIQGWAAVQDERADGLVADYTSISGPDLRHFSRWLRSRLQDPRRVLQGAGQMLRSSYVGVFQVPVLPELVWKYGMTRRYELTARRNVGSDPIRGLALYRTNMASDAVPPRRRRVTVPVHVIVPLKDPFLSPHLVDGLEDWVEDLTVTTVPGGHWWIAREPRGFAGLLDPVLRTSGA